MSAEAAQGSGARLALLAAFAGTSVANYAFSLVMGHLLLPGDFGLLAFAQTLLLVGGLVLESGVPWALTRDLATTPATGRPQLVRGALRGNLTLAAGMSLLVLGLFALGPLRGGLESWRIAALVAGAFPFIALVGVARGAAQGHERFGMLAAVQAGEVVIKALAGTALVVAGLGVIGAVGGFVVGALLAAVLGLWGCARLGVELRGAVTPLRLGVVGPMFGGLLGSALLLNVDLMALKLLGASRSAPGSYQAGLVLASAPYYLTSAVIVPMVFPALARCTSLGGTLGVLGRALATTALLVLPLELLLALVPGPALRLLFPAEYAAGAGALGVRALGSAVFIVATVLAAAFQATGAARRVAVLFLGLVALTAPAFWLVVPRFGAVGAAWVFTGATLVAAGALSAAFLRAAPAPARARVGAWALRYAGVLAAGAVAFLGTIRLGAPPLLAAALAALSYVGAALALRLLPGPVAARPTATLQD